MPILGFQKTTLLDYPDKLAATIFFGGCNFRCPFCHNAPIVLNQRPEDALSRELVIDHLKKRIGILDGVCITGGEPTLTSDLYDFICSVKALGYQIKLDTNGSNPDILASLIQDGLVDYVAMDIKNCKDKYAMTTGRNVDLCAIDQSIHILKDGTLPYEFRTTVIKEFHSQEDFIKIGQWIQGANKYYLQNFVNSDHLICPNHFHSYTKEELNHFVSILEPLIHHVSLRGIDLL